MRIQRAIVRGRVLTTIALGMPILPRDERECRAIRIVFFVRWVIG